MRKIRLFLNVEKLDKGNQIKVFEGDFDYLTKVMRQKIGDKIFVFNGVCGEFLSEIIAIEKKSLSLEIKERVGDLKKAPNISLAFALLKNVGIDFIAKKGVELGVSRFQPLLTQHSVVDKINEKRFLANVKEGLEQCERNDFAQLREVKKLEKYLSGENEDKIFILCDESGKALKASVELLKIKNDETNSSREIVVIIGPEGGFSESEFAFMRAQKNLHAISLGPRILKADTAIVAALTLVQEFLGDWK
jgi:16S rRNA (uracil1498-N3)-methyltransferase